MTVHGLELPGTVIERLPNALFRIELEGGRRVLAHLSGSPERNFVRILAGDRVLVELTRQDATRGRVVRRAGVGDVDSVADRSGQDVS